MFFGILISQEEEESYVVAGATLCCSMGERTSQLQLPMSHGLYMNGKAQVNIKDREPNVNILPFGMCKLGCVCSPKIDMDWTDERSSKMVDGEPAVSNKSKLMCLYGGTIRIEDDGQEIGSGEKEESFWSELWGQAEAFFDGASDAAADDFTLGTLPNEKYTGFKDYSSKYPLSRKAGEVAGNLLGLVVGGAETIIGTGGAAMGGMASVTGVGGSVGVPLTGGSVAVAAHGVSMSTKAALGTGKSASEFWNMFANHNGTQGTREASNISKVYIVNNKALDHANIGDFTKNPRTGEISKMSGGGHGQENIEFLERNGIEYNIEKTYPNGVRIGNVPDHKSKGKRSGIGQAWFPKSWTKEDIRKAGEHVANMPEHKGVADGVTIFGEVNGVRVGVIKTNGEVGTIFPDNMSQP